jgi:histidinol-phosphatase (PHP family)
MQHLPTILTDYHMHSIFSPDGNHSPQELCRQALAYGLKEIAITEHAEWHPSMRHKSLPDAAGYFEAIERCRAEFGPLGLTVYAGVELGNPHLYPAEVGALLREYPFEVKLGSLHWLYGQNIHDTICFTGREPNNVYADYFVELGRMVQHSEFDIVSHFDRILLRGTLLGLPFNLAKLEPVIRETMGLIAQSGRALELNTTYVTLKPNWLAALQTMLTWFYQEGGRHVVVNSDAHRAPEIGRHRALAVEMLATAGFDVPAHLFRVGLVYEGVR